MKVILLKDVPKVGRKYDVTEVPDGHAFNYLIPRKLAERATQDAIARVDSLKALGSKKENERLALFEQTIAALTEKPVSLLREANEGGSLFRAVHEKDIAEALSSAGFPIDQHYISVETPIKSLGEHRVTLSNGVTGKEVKIIVERR